MTTYSYDTWSEKLTGIVTGDYLDTEIQNRSYEYSQAGDIKTITDAVNNDVTYTYSYDELHRLTGETNTGADGPIYYAYNAIGNMTQRIAGTDTFDYSYDPAHPHAVISMDLNGTPYSYTYDDNGNMTAGKDFTDPANPALRTLTWNADNMPVSVTRGGVTTTFKYDGMGQRAKKQVGAGSPTYYIGAEYEVIAGVGTKYIFAGNLRIAKVSSTGVYYFHKDHLGSSTVMTGDTGAVVETSEYLPYGSFRSQTGTAVSDYKFTDQEWDAESGLYNYDARLYDPVIGRFISADSMVPSPFDPQSLNRYSYCRNNPLIYVDPSGHSWSDVGDAIGGMFDAIGDAFSGAVDAVSDAAGAVGDAFGRAVDAVGGWGAVANIGAMAFGAITGNPVAFAAGAIGLANRAAAGNYSGSPVDVGSAFGGPSGGNGGDSFWSINGLRKTVTAISKLDLAPIGAFPWGGAVAGQIVDFGAVLGTQGILTADLATGRVSFGQFIAGSVLNASNYAVGTLGNITSITFVGNLGLSGIEAAIFALPVKVTKALEHEPNRMDLSFSLHLER